MAKSQYSGRFIVRVPEEIHRKLREFAHENNLSLNQACVLAFEKFIAGPFGNGDHWQRGSPISMELIEECRRLWGSALIGMGLFGSAARGEMTSRSDIDLLLVFEAGFPIIRELYSQWDREVRASVSGHEIQPQFVTVPEEPPECGGIWYEFATEGVILWERDFRVSRALSKIRRFMTEGRIRRGVAHGHPSLSQDYLKRSEARIQALQTLFKNESWADVVREAQEIVELCLMGLLRAIHIEVPRIHDVSQILEEQSGALPKELLPHIPRLARISRSLRRDRELAFYGSEDLTPSEFYRKSDAEEALENAGWVFQKVRRAIP